MEINQMPKVELHVHLEGSIQPQLLLELARRNRIDLPVNSAEDVDAWYRFTDFAHFLEIYFAISRCICTPDDIELIARAFLQGQAEQNIRYSEVIFTPHTHFSSNGRIPFSDQMAALARAGDWAAVELGIGVGWVLDARTTMRATLKTKYSARFIWGQVSRSRPGPCQECFSHPVPSRWFLQFQAREPSSVSPTAQAECW